MVRENSGNFKSDLGVGTWIVLFHISFVSGFYIDASMHVYILNNFLIICIHLQLWSVLLTPC